MATNRAIVLVIAAAFLAAACSSKSTPDPEVQADDASVAKDTPVETRRIEPAPEIVDRVAPVDLVVATDALADADSHQCPDCPCPQCVEGERKCMYANTQEKICVPVDCGNGCTCWTWSEPEPCPDNTTCQTPGGCVCDYGACQQGDDLKSLCSGYILTGCDTWACSDGCCVVGKTQNCCELSNDCTDCINLETGEHLQPCPEQIPDGFILNECTIDACMQGECQWIEDDSMCDDGDICTVDECDPLTGACVSQVGAEPNCACILCPCWGETQEDADAKCNDDNACTAQECDYGEDGFASWLGLDPTDPDPDDLEAGIGVCAFKDLSDGCEDDDPCTINGCDPVSGCTSKPDDDNPDCVCETDADCEKLDDNPCTVNKCYQDESLCYIIEYNCDDDCLMTDDVCDPTVPEGEDPCMHLPCQSCPSVVPWEELVCLTDEDCDPGCGAHPLAWEDPEYGCCLDIFCYFPVGAEYGSCAAFEKNCDDGDACTADTCECLYDPFSATCVHEDVPDC